MSREQSGGTIELGTGRPESLFRYPGGKCTLSPWIINHFPAHDCYVEPFAGSAAVFLNKPRSRNEVVNDRDGDIVHFIRTLRKRPDELVAWFEEPVPVPFSRDLHRKFAGEFYAGYRPEDDIERAGRFFYLRYSQFAAKYTRESGFCSSTERNTAMRFVRAREKLTAFAERFDGVQIENRDYRVMFDRFDSCNTLFYCDSPYINEGDALYSHGEFDHRAFVDALNDLEGKAVVSYKDVPDGLEDWRVVEREVQYSSQDGKEGKHKSATERLVMNFDPAAVRGFAPAEQQTLPGVSG